ncbi:hypothetical protein [Nannocystis sp.]|uniref:hypothetical protein n=1 Tax=Nannocystis sp. TaxID=1962667 RepID=UPI00242873DB|nr:hypothetical protein [Nannocystis sp.]MBK7827146.1 hypothetical protein [Nannocystis sp.]MBK9754630.1 hypothetical protein [Nannocystis sp.]
MNNKLQDVADGFTDALSELAQLRDEVKVKIHLASMDARTAWADLQPRLHELDHKLEEVNHVATQSLHAAAVSLQAKLRRLRDDIAQG